MKKVIVVFMLALVLLSCNWERKRKFTIGFSQCLMSDSWRREMVDEMQRELTFYPEVEFVMRSADSSNTNQILNIQQFIDEKVDLLIVSPNESDQLTPIIEKVYDSGIPVVVIDRRTLSDKYTAFVGADNVTVGKNAGLYTNVLLNGSGRVIDIADSPNTTPSQDRTKGFTDELLKHPKLKHLATFWYGKNIDQLEAFLRENEIDLIFAHNDRYAFQTYNTLKKIGLERKVRIIGVDGLAGKNEGLELVKNKSITATILYPTGGEEAIRTAIKILKKQPFEKDNSLYSTIVNPANVEIVMAQYAKIKSQQESIERQAERITNLNTIYDNQRQVFILTLILLGLVVGLGAFFVYLWRIKQKSNIILSQRNDEILKQKEEIERVSLQAREATEEKMRFYSYISHEFKTPLSLILTPTEDLIKRGINNYKEVSLVLELIRKNANRLLRMVNQVLDLRKIDAGKLLINAGNYDLVQFVREIVEDFRVSARKHKIDLKFESQAEVLPFSFDAEKLDKVFFNLLSNAFKFTPDNGKIYVTLRLSGDNVVVEVKDTGVGMNSEDQENAFEMFYRGNQKVNFGVGLGLALSREFVNLHNGEISLESKEGHGTTFSVFLPIDRKAEAEDIQPSEDFTHVIFETIDFSNEITGHEQTKTSLVIIEDDPDLAGYLHHKLSARFSVTVTDSAESGLETVLETMPDVIITDVMLPGKDGFWLTKQVKEDFRTSHIPVIMLTAKGQLESQLEGVKSGADIYMAKPFSQSLLEANIGTLLENRQRQRRRLENEVVNPETVQAKERKFLSVFETMLEKRLSENELSVEQLSRDLGMSRVQLYRKITALTNRNVNDYIADYKIRKAKILLADADNNISEIAYKLGFNSPGYFTTFFKQRTGETPSDWRKE